MKPLALLLAALAAAVGYVLLRPRWRWPESFTDEQWDAIDATVNGTGSTARNNATAWSAAVNTPDDEGMFV